jgi:1,4-dihydroxy-2-naphthoate octaprenyltransferase
VRLGKKDARFGFYFLIFSIYLIILLEVIFKVITPWSFLVLLTLPLAISAAKVSWKNYEKIQELLPANVATIKMHLLTGILMSLAFVVDRWV